MFFTHKCCIVVNIGNEINGCGLPPIKEVRRMIETTLLNIIYILFYSLIGITIIAFALIIAIVVILRKQK